MPSKPAKKKPTRRRASPSTDRAALELQELRRVRAQQRRVQQLSRAVARAARAIDVNRVVAARALLSGTEFRVLD